MMICGSSACVAVELDWEAGQCIDTVWMAEVGDELNEIENASYTISYSSCSGSQKQ